MMVCKADLIILRHECMDEMLGELLFHCAGVSDVTFSCGNVVRTHTTLL